uniref:Methyltransferase type 11 n=1 Tax=uncultured bacterium W5-77b TaxID=1131000 RepID=H9BWH6_9BACT|nr:methyltransferase type 11 [uncultured bacterium W5-77b]
MDVVKKTFDKWAKIGRDELMEREHTKAVSKFLESISFEKEFSFLDIGCGNGWVVRKISKIKSCKKVVGIDKSKFMIKNAISKKKAVKEHYIQSDIESWGYKGKFDFIFSMESLYYSESLEKALAKIFKLLKSGGKFFCGTDFYKDNKATSRWSKQMRVPMHLRSKSEWIKLFKDVGFKTKTRQVKDPKNRKKWKREFGTLFIIGAK